MHQAGLASGPWQHLDETSTRVNGQNRFCQVTCNPLYTSYHTTDAKDRQTMIAFYTKLLLGTEPTPAWRDRLTAALGSANDAKPETIRKAVALILAMPEAQLG